MVMQDEPGATRKLLVELREAYSVRVYYVDIHVCITSTIPHGIVPRLEDETVHFFFMMMITALLLLLLNSMADCTVAAMSSSVLPLRPKTLVTFDIDGTICVSDPKLSALANAMHTKAFSHAFREVYGIDASIDEVSHHGSTDQLILLKGDFCTSSNYALCIFNEVCK
jgi:hypothetical protein